jgi:ketosteroid isomerase-like protein
MYKFFVSRTIRRSFAAVDAHQYDYILSRAVPGLHHEFAGDHALGGARNDRETVRRWFERLGTVLPTLHLTITHLYIKGWPWATTAIVRWDAQASLLDGSEYHNHGAHFIYLRWGKVYRMVVYEDTQAIAHALQCQARSGITEAAAKKIES